MRVAFYSPLKPPSHPIASGDRRVARLLLAAIRQGGNDAFVASTLRAFEGAGDPKRQHLIQRRGEAIARRLITKFESNPPDLWFTYHLYHKAPDWVGPAVCEALSIPYVVAEASIAPKQADGPWSEGYNAILSAVRRASRIITLNPDDRACIEPVVRSPERIVMLPPFIDTRPVRRTVAKRVGHRTDLSRQLGIPTSDIWIAVSAMMRPGDKLESYRVLGRAMQRLQDLPLRWLVAGDGAARGEVEAALDAGTVSYLGSLGRRDMDNLHAAADVAVWPAIREAFGMALLEAQAAGLPVVAGRSPGVAQIVADGETGLLTTPGDDKMLADAVRILAGNAEQRRSMGQAAMKKAENQHDISSAARQIGRVLQEAKGTRK